MPRTQASAVTVLDAVAKTARQLQDHEAKHGRPKTEREARAQVERALERTDRRRERR